MALEFIQTDQGPAKLQFSKDQESKFTENEKKEMTEIRDAGYLTSKESEFGNTNGTIPKEVINEQEIVDEKEVVTTDDGKFSIDIMGALSNVGDAAGSALSSIGSAVGDVASSTTGFVQDVGSNLSAIAQAVPAKIEEISKDPDKKRNFMRGLEIINASSGIKPISQAKSPIGAISEGLLKAEKGFIAENIALKKAENKNLNKNYTRKDLAMNADFKDYNDKYRAKQGDYRSTELIYSMAKKAANDGKELPTGIIQKSFAGFEKAITEIPGGAKILDGLLKRNEGTTKMSSEDAVVFKDLLQSAVKQKIVSRVKELYPVSNKDIEILLQTVGDVGTSPEALRRLIAMQMGIQDIEKTQKTFVNKLYSDGDMNFRDNSLAMSEQQLLKKYKDEVRPETLEALYGKDYGDISAAGMVSAKYYQDLETKFAEDSPDSFYNIFTEEQTKKQEDIIDQIKKFQEDGKEDLPGIPKRDAEGNLID